MDNSQVVQTIIRRNVSYDEIDINNLSDNNIDNNLNSNITNNLQYESIKRVENRVIYASLAIYILAFYLIFILNRSDYSISKVYNMIFYSPYETINKDEKNNELVKINNTDYLNLVNNFQRIDTIKLSSDKYPNNSYVSKKTKGRSLFPKNKEMSEELRLKERIFKDLFRYSYFGNWTSDSKIMDFHNNSGEIRIIMHLTTNFRFRDIYLSYIIFLYDGNQKKKWIMIENKLGISLNSTKIEKINGSEKLEIKHSNMLVVAYEFEIFENIQKNFLSWNMHYFLDKSIFRDITGKIDNMIFSKASFTINFKVSREIISFFSKILSLSVFLCLIGIIQTISSRRLIESFERNLDISKNVKYIC